LSWAGGWLAADPGKAWIERFFLLYSPAWMERRAMANPTIAEQFHCRDMDRCCAGDRSSTPRTS